MNLILTRQPSIKVLDSEKTSGNPSGTRRWFKENILKKIVCKRDCRGARWVEYDAADNRRTFSSKKEEVISELDDLERKDIIDLLRYDEDSAGGLMGKELVKSTKKLRYSLCKGNARSGRKCVSSAFYFT
jgi:magnesium transporter